MSKLNEISGNLLAIANLPPENRNKALLDLSIIVQGSADNEIEPAQRDLIASIIEDLIAENDAEQIVKSKLVFSEEVEEQIAPTKKTRAKKVVAPVIESTSDDLPDTIDPFTKFKDLPEPVQKLIRFRRKQQGIKTGLNLDGLISGTINIYLTPEDFDFWDKITNLGDLRDFKQKYGNKGEKVDEMIEFEELNQFVQTLTPTPAPVPTPVVANQEVKYVEVIVYPPSGGVLNLKTYSIIELSALTTEILKTFKVNTYKINFKTITDKSSSNAIIDIKSSDTYLEILDNLITEYDKFVTPELYWEKFAKTNPDIDRVALNSEILQDSFKKNVVVPVVTPKPAPVVTPKPAPVVTPKPVKVVVPKVVTPKPAKVVAPKPAKVVAPKPAKVVAPKPAKVVAPKVTKPKVKDDLSFLDDLDNIF